VLNAGTGGHTGAIWSVSFPLPSVRLTPADAVRLLLSASLRRSCSARRLPDSSPEILAQMEIAGGAVYDALVALAAAEHGADLATRDALAKDTYDRVGAHVIGAG